MYEGPTSGSKILEGHKSVNGLAKTRLSLQAPEQTPVMLHNLTVVGSVNVSWSTWRESRSERLRAISSLFDPI